ncbi:hypothetical protein DY000_02052556 [Brassica cretica]|uniref:Uncharacterized protein n=1 Tax=Brassica cretica TaxID=69181 RepID=A0ABQ7A7U7_BRACR|nr:hypothetical protein DY000_02052556 [Brassica cretica]
MTTICVHNRDIRRVLERASSDEPSYICLPEHANLFTQTKLVPEIYTKDDINEMFYGVCEEHEKNKEAFQMKLDGVYYPLNDIISWLTTCMEEMKQDIARIQHATDIARPPSIDRHHHTSIDNHTSASIDDNPPRPHTKKSQKDLHTREEIDQLVEEIYRGLETTEKRLVGRCDHICFPMDLSISALISKIEAIQRELVEIQSYIARQPEKSLSIDRRNKLSTDIHHRTSVDFAVPTSVDRQPEFGRRAYDLYGNKKFYWEEKDEYGVYRDDRRYARDLDGNTIRLHNTDIRRVLERASRDEPSYICLHEHANLFTQTKLVPEIYTKDKINEMFYGVCGEHEKNKEAFQMKLDGVYYPLNDSISWFTTCMEEMKQNIAIIQHATDVARPPSIDRRRPPSIDNPMPSSIDDSPPRPHMKKSQKDFHTREEIYQLVEEIYRALETTEERLDGRCDDIYFPMHLSISALTSKIEALQKELVEIQSYIARRPEASLSIDRSTNISTDIHHQTSVDDTTNRGRLVPKMTSDMSDTHYYGEEISAATYATLRRHQFNLENLEERLQRMENPTVTMKEKWRRGDEAIREFTDSTKDTKVDQPVNYPLLLRLF